jgi:phosphate transport system substrate-binding protein
MRILLLLSLSVALLLASCDNKYEAKKPDDVETINSGKLSIYVDETLEGIIDSTFSMYEVDYPNVELTVNYENSRNTMSQLLGGETRIAVNARDYLDDELAQMEKFAVEKHKRFALAYDGLVLFVKNDFPIDTLNAVDLENAISQGSSLSKSVFNLEFEPTYATLEQNSSVFANFSKYISKNDTLKKKVELLSNIDELKKHVASNNSIIGIAYLSHLINDDRFKMLQIGFQNDSTDEYISPKPVHQGYIVQDLYPFKVTYWGYLLEDRQNLPFWFVTYLAKQTIVQQYFLNQGVVPAFAKIKLKYEE